MASERPAEADWPAQEWWKRYQDPTLDRLIDLAVASSPTLATAHARYDSARQSVRVAGAAAGAQRASERRCGPRSGLSDNGLFPPQLLGLHLVQPGGPRVAGELHLRLVGQAARCGGGGDGPGARRAGRPQRRGIDAGEFDRRHLLWMAGGSEPHRCSPASARAPSSAKAKITAARVDADLDPADEPEPRPIWPWRRRANRSRHLEGSAKLRVVALAALVGRSDRGAAAAGGEDRCPRFPATCRTMCKIDLIARRADIAASRWRVRGGGKESGFRARRILSGRERQCAARLSSIDVGKLLEYGSRVPQASAAIHLPIFDAGRLKARYGASQAAIDSAVASYQDTVVGAARDVATQASTRAQIAAQRTQRMIEVDAALPTARERRGARAPGHHRFAHAN